MPFVFNGNTPQSIIYNGKTVKKLVYNNIEVWTRTPVPETWKLNENLSNTVHDTCSYDCDFRSDGIVFNNLSVTVSGQQFYLKYDDITTCDINGNAWTAEEYQTLYFPDAPTGELRAWLIANGTKQ